MVGGGEGSWSDPAFYTHSVQYSKGGKGGRTKLKS